MMKMTEEIMLLMERLQRLHIVTNREIMQTFQIAINLKFLLVSVQKTDGTY